MAGKGGHPFECHSLALRGFVGKWSWIREMSKCIFGCIIVMGFSILFEASSVCVGLGVLMLDLLGVMSQVH